MAQLVRAIEFREWLHLSARSGGNFSTLALAFYPSFSFSFSSSSYFGAPAQLDSSQSVCPALGQTEFERTTRLLSKHAFFGENSMGDLLFAMLLGMREYSMQLWQN